MFLTILKLKRCTTRPLKLTHGKLKDVLHRFKTQKMCNEEVCMDSYNLEFVPGHLKTQEMCIKAV